MEPVILKGDAAKAAIALGYGYGYGDGDGHGYGYGYGDGSGYGYGDGDGHGYGYGEGDGYGDGEGPRYGYGAGDGSGAGYGYGYGDGSGYGYGDGDGHGYGDYWLSCLSYFTEKWTDTQKNALKEAQKTKLKIAFWRSKKNGQPSNGGKTIETAAPGVIHIAPGPLNLCHAGTLHATLLPQKWDGERWWVVALHGEIIGDEEKYGCLKREILGECL